ncbi:LysR family transcriptional regulator [Microbacterium sp. JC 701]|uniref:LysR family transcriptional regulator n=1 Tax=Microbacterium algihabitans TaxID=3075992 RepID=A0ABU3RXB8_9MICO|nr:MULTISPECIES: LysR family transcriptional regulator [unclassified Microbacterium]MCD2170964.1 LysR family transcriptional regulator [Microbacterium sp. JC 701]MDU0327536.1 LysR family transcriptional regulator [Microbacterium sp. KSW2-21]
MDVVHLRLLRELRDRGSVAAVAAALHVSPSAVSQQLAALQARVNVPLTTRSGRVLALTSAGEALAAAGTRVDEALTEAREAVGAFVESADRPVRVSAFHSAGLALFGPLLRELAGTPPLHLADADVAHRDFPGLTADHDIVLAHRLAHDEPWPADRVVTTPLLTEPLDVALPATHPLAARRVLHAADVADEAWVSVHEGFPLAGVLDHLAAHVGRPLRIAHRINEFSVTAEVVRAGAAIAIMPRTTSTPLAVDGLVLRPLVDLDLVRHVDALTRPDALAYAAVRRVLAALVAVARAAERSGTTGGIPTSVETAAR